MLLGVDAWVVVVLAVALFVGAVVQGTIGLGLGLIAAPVASLVAPELVPEVVLWLAMLMAVESMAIERAGTDWRGLSLALPPRVVGTAVGVWVVAQAPASVLGVGVGLMVLLTVLLTVRTVRIPVNRISLPIAGFVSGIAGTATSIGGPPLAVLYQHHPPAVLRPTLSTYFAIGAALSLVGLGLAGQLELRLALLALVLAPVLALGILVSIPVRRRVPHHLVRALVLVVCGLSSLALIVRSLV